MSKNAVGRPKRFKPNDIIEALKLSRGMKMVAAKHLGCTPKTIYDYCARYPEVAEACKHEREVFVDMLELQLFAAAQRGEAWAVIYGLKTLGRERGYTERHEVTGKDGGPIEHAHIHVWEEHLQRAHARLEAHKEAIRLERTAGGAYERPADTP